MNSTWFWRDRWLVTLPCRNHWHFEPVDSCQQYVMLHSRTVKSNTAAVLVWSGRKRVSYDVLHRLNTINRKRRGLQNQACIINHRVWNLISISPCIFFVTTNKMATGQKFQWSFSMVYVYVNGDGKMRDLRMTFEKYFADKYSLFFFPHGSEYAKDRWIYIESTNTNLLTGSARNLRDLSKIISYLTAICAGNVSGLPTIPQQLAVGKFHCVLLES